MISPSEAEVGVVETDDSKASLGPPSLKLSAQSDPTSQSGGCLQESTHQTRLYASCVSAVARNHYEYAAVPDRNS